MAGFNQGALPKPKRLLADPSVKTPVPPPPTCQNKNLDLVIYLRLDYSTLQPEDCHTISHSVVPSIQTAGSQVQASNKRREHDKPLQQQNSELFILTSELSMLTSQAWPLHSHKSTLTITTRHQHIADTLPAQNVETDSTQITCADTNTPDTIGK